MTQTFRQAVRHHREGQLQQAEKLYRQIVRVDPGHADALNLLGVACHQRQRGEEAVKLLKKAVALNRTAAPYHNNLAMAYRGVGRYADAVKCYRKALNLQPDYPEARFNLGIALYERQEFAAAEECFRRALTSLPANADVLLNLGNALQGQEKFEEALGCFRRIIEVDLNHFEAEFNLGNCFKEQGRRALAAEHFQRAAQIKPDSAVAHFQLANMLQLENRFEEAARYYERAIEINPDYVEAHNNLGAAWDGLREFDRAVDSFRRATEIDPEYAEAHNNLGRTLHQQGKLAEALTSIERALGLKPALAEAHLNLGEVYLSARRVGQAHRCFQQVVSLDPESARGWRRLAGVYKMEHRTKQAADAFRRGARDHLDRPLPQLWLGTLCPAVFGDDREIDDCRNEIESEIRRIAAIRPRPTFAEISEFGTTPPSNLQYQNRNNRPLLEAFASIYRGCLPEETPRAGTGKPKIGFVVTTSHEGIFFRYLGGVIERLNRELFDPVIVCSPVGAGFLRQMRISDAIELCVVPLRHDLLVDAMRAARFDVLCHFEVGTDTKNYFLPFFRLAPIQCVLAGNAQTTGLEEIDYFISSELHEPADADDHYTETLIRLDGLASYQKRVALPPSVKTREDFGFRSDQHLYACPQKLRKLGPDIDPLLNEILEHDPRGVLALVEDAAGFVANQLRGRLRRTMPAVFDRVVFLPRLSISDYLGLTAAADVLLDPLHYGGGSTMYDAFSLNKSVVTLPGRFARGRYALGFYRASGISDCVASSPAEYVEIALSLGKDADFRRSVEQRIAQAGPLIFENANVVTEYERAFLHLVEQARGR